MSGKIAVPPPAWPECCVCATNNPPLSSGMPSRTRSDAGDRKPPLPRGRPPIHDEAWIKVSVVLFKRQVRDLDRLTSAMRRKTGTSLTRAEVIRNLIDALNESRLDVTKSQSGAQLKRLLVNRLSGRSSLGGR